MALDVETTLYSRRLCLVQLGTREEIFIVDAFQIDVEQVVGDDLTLDPLRHQRLSR